MAPRLQPREGESSAAPIRSRPTWKTPALAGVEGGTAVCFGPTCIVYIKWFLTLHGGRDGKTQSALLKQSGQQLPVKTLSLMCLGGSHWSDLADAAKHTACKTSLLLLCHVTDVASPPHFCFCFVNKGNLVALPHLSNRK